MDIFVEYIVKKNWKTKEYLTAGGIILGAMVLLVLLVFAGGFIGIDIQIMGIVVIAAGVGVWWIINQMRTEFEYSVTNGYVAVDKIIARKNRKRLVSFESKQVQKFGKYKAVDHERVSYDTTIMAHRNDDGEDYWYAVFKHKSLGNTLVVFSPNESILNGMKPFLPRDIKFAIWGRK